MSYQTIQVTETEARLTIMLNRPEALNSLTLDLFGEFEQALAQAATRQNVRVVVVTGAGRAFSAGVDPQPAVQLRANGLVGNHQIIRLVFPLGSSVAREGKRTIKKIRHW